MKETMTTLGRASLIVVALLLGGSAPPAAQGGADQAAIAQAALTDVIRPGYAAFAGAADALQGKMDVLCQDPSAPSLAQAKQAFAATVAAWSKVEILRFGPVTQDHRFERLFFWPDPKGIGLKQVQQALAEKDEDIELPDELAGKSVAIQGLPALEYLLYGDGAEVLAKERQIVGENSPPEVDTEGAFRCGFALAVATNIDRIAQAVVEDWREGSAYEKAFLGPVPEDPIYHSPKEVTLDLFKSFTAGIELVRDQKLGKPLGPSPVEAKPKLAAFWLSGLTFANAAGNLAGVRTLFAKGGFAQIVANESAGVEKSILFDLDHAIEVLGGIDLPMTEVATDDDMRAKIEALRVALKSAAQTAGDMIARGAGLAFGFNAMDGD
jgi:predicted lipoprotein